MSPHIVFLASLYEIVKYPYVITGFTHTQATTTEQREERSQEAVKDRRRKGTQVLEGILECLSGVPKGVLDHTQMNTSVKERRAPQQRMQRGVEGHIPTQGQRPLLPRDTRRGETTHYDTPSTRQGNQAVARSNRYLEGGTSINLDQA